MSALLRIEMPVIKTISWNSVVVGKWNPAILSPKGIAKEIFEKADNTPIEVLVQLDAMGPIKVKIDNLLISADFDRLVIDCEKSSWDYLENSRNYCVKAIEALPKTPVSAAGFNIRYELSEPKEAFIDLLVLPLDTNISDNGITIERREIRRSLEWENGTINLHVIKDREPNYKILLNFDKKSDVKDELTDWLQKKTDNIKAITKIIMCDVLKTCEKGDII